MYQRWIAFGLTFVFATPVVASDHDPLLRMPCEANLVVVAEQPRKLVETLRNLDAYQSAQTLPQVREALNSTTLRRFYQLLGYYERALGTDWPQLLDKLAGNGIAFGTVTGTDPAPTLLVVQGTDEPTTTEFVKLALKALEEEVARQAGSGANADDSKLRHATYKGCETVHLGKEFHAARMGAVLYIATQEVALQKGLDLAVSKSTNGSIGALASPKAARKLLGGEPLAWVWFDFAKTKESQATKDFFEATRKDFLQTLVLGSSIDAVRRSDFITAGLYGTSAGLKAVLKLPAKRADLPPEFVLHAPPAGQPASLPLLEPKGAVYSQSFYLDFGTLWIDRKKLLNEQQLKDFEKADKDISKLLPGTTFSKLLEMSGPYHRVVAVNTTETLYDKSPDVLYPAAAIVTSMRDPQFGKTATSALRAAGFVASTQTGVKMTDETHDGVKIVTYRFPEDKPFPNDTDPGNLRFNTAPSFAVVGEHLVVASRPSLIKELIPELRKPLDPAKSSTAVWRGKGYGNGAAEFIRNYPDALITNTVLTQGIGLDEAKKQVRQIADWLQTLGNPSLEIDHQTDAYELKFEWKFGPSSGKQK